MAIFNISHSEDGKKLLSLKSPVDLSDIDTYECTSAGKISTIMSQAKIAQASWKKTTLKERVELMHRVADVVIQQQEKIMDVVMRETGKPQQEAMSMEVPCITSKLANNALGAKRESEILIGETPQEYVELIKRLINNEDLRNNLTKNAKLFVEQNYNWNSISKFLIKDFFPSN